MDIHHSLPQSGLSTHFAWIHFTSDQIGKESVDVVLCQCWQVNSCRVQNLSVMTAEDKMVQDNKNKHQEILTKL